MSFALNRMSDESKTELRHRLWEKQNGLCFITRKKIDLVYDQIDIDHVIPTRDKGADDESNWALTFASANRSKQASHLYVARVLHRLQEIRESGESTQGANLGDILKTYGGAKFPFWPRIEQDRIFYKFQEMGEFEEQNSPMWNDKLSKINSVFMLLPIEYLHHDDQINPRSIGNSIRGLIEEFHRGRPQLHIPLGWLNPDEGGQARVKIFDGQHKAAAQILLDQRYLPVRVFITNNKDLLVTTNTNAGTTLRQIAFDKSTQRHLGATILGDRISRFRQEKSLSDDSEIFSESDLVEHFRGEQAQMRRYVLDAQRSAVSHHDENLLKNFIEWSGKSGDKPISYSTIEKTFYSLFIGKTMLQESFFGVNNDGYNSRELERQQLIRLMSLIAVEYYAQGRFDESIGTSKIESILVKGNRKIPDNHIRACRICREEVLMAWLPYVRRVIVNYFTNNGQNVLEERLFQYKFPDQLWQNLENFLRRLGNYPMWTDDSLANTAFGGKSVASVWDEVFRSGKNTSGITVLGTAGLNILEMIKPS